jgi:hypothetical protein
MYLDAPEEGFVHQINARRNQALPVFMRPMAMAQELH